MKKIMYMLMLLLLLFIFLPLRLLADIPYCVGTQVDNVKDSVIQKTVSQFAKSVACHVGKNCLLKWDDHGTEKFSIAWREACGPIVNGVAQLGDNGQGSTFVCTNKENNICCYPLGYDYVKDYIICSESKKN